MIIWCTPSLLFYSYPQNELNSKKLNYFVQYYYNTFFFHDNRPQDILTLEVCLNQTDIRQTCQHPSFRQMTSPKGAGGMCCNECLVLIFKLQQNFDKLQLEQRADLSL